MMKLRMAKNSGKPARKKTASADQIRLQKIIADAGILSRRKAEEAILEGLVKVNGKTVKKLGVKANPDADQITYKGKLLQKAKRLYILLNKPTGIICTTDDPEDRKTVTGLINEIHERLFPVGRLDVNTTGIILLTNDGDFAQKMMRPSFKVRKRYSARVRGKVENHTLKKMESGITYEGVKYKFKSVRVERVTGKNSLLNIELTEGKKHHIKNLCQVLGHPVVKLARVAYGNLKLSGLRVGDYRHLSGEEVSSLLRLAKKPPAKKRVRF